MKNKIIFSVITPVLNSEKFIKKNLLSIKQQSFQNFEHIIVDGGSKDKTIEIIKKYRNKKTRVIIKKDKNLWEAINNGIKISQGKYLCVLNSDDYFYKNALETIYKYFKKNNNLSYIFGAVRKNNRILYRLEKEKIYYKFNVYPSHSVSFFIKNDIQKKLGYYNTDLDICSDYDLFFKLFNKKNIYGTNTKKKEVIGFFRPGGLSEKISITKKLFYEFKIRYKNNQNIFYLILLLHLTLLNIIKNLILKFFLKSFKNV